MSTRSIIAMKTGENTCLAIRCHFNGYPEYNGVILLAAYDTEEKVRALLALGDLCRLGPELGEKHSRDENSHREWCFAYGRDTNEKGTEARHRTMEELGEGWIDYIYVFDPTRALWQISRDGRIFMPLAEHPDLHKPNKCGWRE